MQDDSGVTLLIFSVTLDGAERRTLQWFKG